MTTVGLGSFLLCSFQGPNQVFRLGGQCLPHKAIALDPTFLIFVLLVR